MWSIDSVWTWRKSSWRIDSAVPKNGMSPCGTLSIVGASNWLRQCCKASKLVCRILIPEAAGGPRLRYDARPRLIMMASSVHHADNAERYVLLSALSHKGTIRREVNWWDPGSCLQAMNETS
jgi:hypothetical protein